MGTLRPVRRQLLGFNSLAVGELGDLLELRFCGLLGFIPLAVGELGDLLELRFCGLLGFIP